jgi:hypothetical protein
MDPEGILAIIFLFGGGALVAMSFGPVGRAIADRIRGSRLSGAPDPAVYEELDRLRQELTELHERVEFNERLLSSLKQPDQLPGA